MKLESTSSCCPEAWRGLMAKQAINQNGHKERALKGVSCIGVEKVSSDEGGGGILCIKLGWRQEDYVNNLRQDSGKRNLRFLKKN